MATKYTTGDMQNFTNYLKSGLKMAQSFGDGAKWAQQIQSAYDDSQWQQLENLYFGVIQAQAEFIERNKPSARQLPAREPTPQERLDAIRRKK